MAAAVHFAFIFTYHSRIYEAQVIDEDNSSHRTSGVAVAWDCVAVSIVGIKKPSCCWNWGRTDFDLLKKEETGKFRMAAMPQFQILSLFTWLMMKADRYGAPGSITKCSVCSPCVFVSMIWFKLRSEQLPKKEREDGSLSNLETTTKNFLHVLLYCAFIAVTIYWTFSYLDSDDNPMSMRLTIRRRCGVAFHRSLGVVVSAAGYTNSTQVPTTQLILASSEIRRRWIWHNIHEL